MATEVFIPKMTDFMETGVIVNWLVKEGEKVDQGQPFLEVETDKATSEVEAPASGFLKGIRRGAQEGATVPVGETIAFIVARLDESIPSLPPLSIGEQASSPAASKKSEAGVETIPSHEGGIRATPVARRIAKELGVNLALVTGSGPEGRISEQDLRTHIALLTHPPELGSQTTKVETTKRTTLEIGKTVSIEREFEQQALNNIQRLTGQRMLESIQVAPQFALTVAVDMTNALQLLESLTTQIEATTGKKLSITGILVKVAANALRAYPRANASFSDGNLKLWKQVNIGVAMGTENGLVVPVIHDADRKSLQQIAMELDALQENALQLRFTPTELTGGTFTISNLGMYGIDRFNAILNPPEAAILAVGRIIKIPVALSDDSVGVRPIIQLTLTIDHRCLDGLQGAKLLSEIKNHLEQPNLIVEI